MDYILIFLICLIGSVIQTICGFGYAMIGISILSIMLPIKTVNLLIIISSSILSLKLLFRLRKSIDYRLIIYPSITIFPSVLIGIRILNYGKESHLKIIIGSCLILIAFYFIFQKKSVEIKRVKLLGMAAGMVSGIFVGIASIAGPPLAIYCMNVTKKKETYIVTLQAIFLISGLYSLGTHIYYGNITIEILKYALLAIIAVIIGNIMGVKVNHRINYTLFYKLIYGYILNMGILIILLGIYL